jgi:hypothetical protein
MLDSTRHALVRWGLVALALLAPATASAFDYDEAVSSDLSTDPATPTALSVTPSATNRLRGSVVASTDTRDYVTFTIPAGQVLTQLRLIHWDQLPSGAGNRGFHAIKGGATGVVPDSLTQASLLGGDHVDVAHIGTDRLPELKDGLSSGSAAGTGFSLPLPAGTYTYLIQQTSTQQMSYELEFVVAAAPPPVPAAGLAAIALLGSLLGAGGLVAARRRRRR